MASSMEKLNNESDDIKKESFIKNDYRTLWGYFDQEIKWFNAIAIFALHFYSLYLCVLIPKTIREVNLLPIILFQHLYSLFFCGFGVTGGAHRYYTHKCFKATLPMRIYLMLAYSSSSQNKLLDWVRDHRVHHKFSDTHADPHNSNRGFFFSHCGWLMMKKRPEVIEQGQKIDFSDIINDPVAQFHHRYFPILWIFLGHAVPIWFSYKVLGYSFLLSLNLNIIRWVLQLNLTWGVNSVAHIWGTRPYDKNICPVNVSLLLNYFQMGEGWHNYHHAFPWDYKASEWPYYFNWTSAYLNFFAKIGWIYDLKEPSGEMVRKTVKKFGDGTHYIWGRDEVSENGIILKHIQ